MPIEKIKDQFKEYLAVLLFGITIGGELAGIVGLNAKIDDEIGGLRNDVEYYVQDIRDDMNDADDHLHELLELKCDD